MPENGLRDGESLAEVFEELKRDFHHRPGEQFFRQLDDAPAFVAELHPHASATSMALVSLLVDATRQGIDFWETERIAGFYSGGTPPRAALDLLTAFAVASGKPVRLYYDGPQEGGFLCYDFAP